MKTTNNNYELKTWILTDDDCFQHMKKLSDDGKQWRMVQLYSNIRSKYYAGYADVDLNDYLYPIDDDEAETIINILSGYGYDEFIFGVDYNTELEHYELIIKNIKNIYGDKYLQIVAECIAEYEIGPDYYIIEPKNGVNFNQAKKIAYEFMKGDDN